MDVTVFGVLLNWQVAFYYLYKTNGTVLVSVHGRSIIYGDVSVLPLNKEYMYSTVLRVLGDAVVTRSFAKEPVFRIHAILVWIRIRTRGSIKIKSKKKSRNSTQESRFSYYFCLIIEGSGRLKNMWIRIRNTVKNKESTVSEGMW